MTPGRTFKNDGRGVCLNCGRSWGGHAASSCYEPRAGGHPGVDACDREYRLEQGIPLDEDPRLRLLCECESWDCRLTIEADLEQAAKAHDAGLVLISNRCVHGPEFTDRLVESRDGYSVYREP